jgi:hypothetical protein
MNFAETFPHQVVIQENKPAMYADICDVEFYAIGKMTTSWAILEHSMMFAAIQLAKQYKSPAVKDSAPLPIVRKLIKLIMPATHMTTIPRDFTTLPFETRFRVFRILIKSVPAGPARARLENIASRIASVQAERHDFTHGIWDWNATSPTKIRVDHIRKKGRWRHKQYDSEAMLNFAKRIAQINFELCYREGLEQFYEAKAQSGNYMSRRFMIDISGVETRDPTLRFSNVPLPSEIRHALDRLVVEQGDSMNDGSEG